MRQHPYPESAAATAFCRTHCTFLFLLANFQDASYNKYRPLQQPNISERRTDMQDVTLRTFPDNDIEALAMLYLQNQDLSDVTPEELLDKYQDAYERIKARKKQNREAQRQNWKF